MQLGDYTLTEKIGEGATGKVYRAYDRRRGRAVAVKLTHNAPDSTALTQLGREARTLHLQHPNILAAERLETLSDGRLLVVMPLFEGAPLTSWLVPVALERALGVVRQVAEALAYAHAQGVLHCDVKPANLLVSGGQVKLLDFGLSRRLSDVSEGVRGTLEYMSPEAARGQDWLPSSDLWSLGVVLYELLTGHTPFGGKSVPDTLRAIAEARPRPVSEHQLSLPPETDLLLARLLSASPGARYPSAEALLRDLEALAAGRHLTVFEAETARAPSARLPTPESVRALPPKPATLLGRHDELALLSHYLSDPDCRLLTLQGLGGVGKTHLSLWLAHDLRGFSHVHFVALADVPPDGFVAALSAALGLEESGLTALRLQLAGRKQFLLLDNFEHLTEQASVLGALLEACPQLVILVTTRLRLGLAEEWVIPLQGLSFPAELPDLATARTFGALALLEHRARVLSADFDLARDLESAYTICSRLQGHALGITLAAGLLRHQPIEVLTRTLEATFAGLEQGSGRHVSLQAVFEQSCALLTPPQRRLLSALTLFEGGGEARAVQEITGADEEALEALMDASLLEQTLEGRYVQHPVVRQFSRELLDTPDAETLGRYRVHYGRELERLDVALRGSGRRRALLALARDAPNLRAALHEAVVRPELGEPLRVFYTQQGRYLEGLELFRPKIEPFAQACAGWFALLLGDLERAEASVVDALQADDLRVRLIALNTQAGMLARHNDLKEAKAKTLEVLALARQYDATMVGPSLNNLAMIEEFSGNSAAAISSYEESLELAEAQQDYAQTLVSINNLASLYLYTGNIGTGNIHKGSTAKAKALLEKGLVLSDKHRLTRMKPLLQINFGFSRYLEADYANAEAAYLEAERGLLERGDQATAITARAYLGQTYGAQGDVDRAYLALHGALAQAQESEDQQGLLCTLVRLAELLYPEQQGEAEALAALVYHHAFSEPVDRYLAARLGGSDQAHLSLEATVQALLPAPTLTAAAEALRDVISAEQTP